MVKNSKNLGKEYLKGNYLLGVKIVVEISFLKIKKLKNIFLLTSNNL
jgi:hypothetical protein